MLAPEDIPPTLLPCLSDKVRDLDTDVESEYSIVSDRSKL